MSQLSFNIVNNFEDQTVKFQVDGKILNELSKQVTNHIFALGELIKNSYDAQATYIKITLDLKNSLLTVDDNGIGISKENIQSILHIAKSNKKYAKKITFVAGGRKIERFTQGSKGLGLFSAFKFGNIVNWDTKCENSDSFRLTVDKNQVTKLSNISNATYKLKLGERKSRGTTITIKLDNNDKEILFTYNYLKDQINTKRLVNFFLDDSLIIDFNLIKKDGTLESNFPIKTIKNSELEKDIFKKNLFKITFSSNENNLNFFYKDNNSPFKKFNYEFKNKLYTIKFTIYAFVLKTGEKKLINSLFLNSRNDLTPLIYINGALFNNDNIFDPSITRKIKSSKTLPQLVGFIDITCTHPDLQFNNERTDLVFNSFNESLKEDIKNINIFLQEKGKYLERNLSSFIIDEDKTDPNSQPDESDPNPQPDETDPNSQPDESDPNSQPDEAGPNPQPDETDPNSQPDVEEFAEGTFIPYIKLNENEKVIRFIDQSGIIDLKTFFYEAKDSKGNNISVNQLKMSIDGKILPSTLIPSTDQSKTLLIKFFFVDVNLKDHNQDYFICHETLTLKFQKKNFSFDPDNVKQVLIEPIGYKDYKIKLEGVDRLIKQINQLYINYEAFDMCLASSIRVVFDLSTYRYQQFHPKQTYKSSGLESQVEEIIQRIKENKNHFTEVTSLLDARHKVNKNIFDPGHFSKKVEISNLGSHTGSSHLSIETIKDIAKAAGYYAQLIDAHCKVMGFIEK
ncbi:ATP-binding protein [Acinetobacter pittii]|uniref:ATP-binding protein n=1 Tax=Acinetobacter pittii TaxID=48296 RepID=UPI0024DE926F|nr:ATP-binding protein [Acinetobacter pittii]